MARAIDIYGRKDPRRLSRYSGGGCVLPFRLSPASPKTWVDGRIDAYGSRLLSFQNLVEAHVLASIRREHGVSLQRVRKALTFVGKKLHQPHPLVTTKFQTDGPDLFVEELGKLINASQNGQLAITEALRASLDRVEHDDDGLAARLFPFIRRDLSEPRVIVVDPKLSFGRPVIAKTGVPVSAVVGALPGG